MPIDDYVSEENNPYVGVEGAYVPDFSTGGSDILSDSDVSIGNFLPEGEISYMEGGVYPDDYSREYFMLQAYTEELAQTIISTQGYFNTSVLDILDRIVSASEQHYYIAYRYDNDAYNAYLYLSNDIKASGTVYDMYDAELVHIYRVRYGTSSTYNYYLTRQNVGDVQLDISASSLSYTNMIHGMPILGGKADYDIFTQEQSITYGMLAVIIVLLLFTFRRR